MSSDRKRIIEVRMIVIVMVNVADPSLIEVLAATAKNPSSLSEVVSSEVVSNLESVSYVEAVIVSQL